MNFKQEIHDYIKSGETSSKNLGLEIEHFVIDKDGKQISFDQITSLIEKAGKELQAEIQYIDGFPVGYHTDRYAISLEPSCQFEISINPYSSLNMIADVYQEFFSLWQPIFEEIGYRIETKGNLPLVELGLIDPNDIPLSPKKRYKYMDAYFKNSGKYGKYMMRASASTQISIDYASQQDLIRKLRILEKISPILMTMMENKTKSDTRLPEEQEKTHLLRIQEWDDLDPERTGFFPYSFDDDFGYDKIADVVYHTPLILLTDKGETTYIGHQDAAKLVEDHVILEDDDPDRTRSLVEHVLSMGFFHFRIKKYIEIRIADSVPIDKALGYTALLKGIVYSDDNLDTLEQELKDIDTLTKIQDAVLAIERKGSDAVIYHGKTVKDWSDYLIHLARNSLPETEKGYLDHV